MAKAIGRGREAPSCFFLQEFLSKYPPAVLIIFDLEHLNHQLCERCRLQIKKVLFPEYLVSAGMGDQISDLETGDIVDLRFHLQLLAR